MSRLRIRPRSAIADPALAREAVVELPGTAPSRRARARSAIAGRIETLRRPSEPERIIVLTLVPVHARRR